MLTIIHVVCVRLSVSLCITYLLPDTWTNRPEIFRGFSQDHWPCLGRMWLGLGLHSFNKLSNL